MKKRILHIGNDLPHAGFTPNYMAFLGRMLRGEGHEVKVPSGRNNKLLRLVDIFLLVFRNRTKADLVLIDTYGTRNFYFSLATGMLCQWLNLPYIPVLHGGSLPSRIASAPTTSRSFFRKARIIVAPSAYLEEAFRAAGFQNLRIIPNALQLNKYPYKARRDFQPRLLWVRRFEKMYNPLMALEVFEKLLTKYPGAVLCMVGPEKDGSLNGCIKAAAEKGLPVRFTGILGKKEWIRLSGDFDFFLNTTTVDNMPISVMEAMALGLAVVSTNVGGLPFLVEDGKDGILVPNGDVDAMAKALEGLLENQERTRRISLAARAKMEHYDWSEVRIYWEDVLATSTSNEAPPKEGNNAYKKEVKLP